MMRIMAVTVLLAFLALTLASAIPKPNGKHGEDRVLNKKLSEQNHFEDGDEHNPDYDHEAFLGEQDAQEFENLSPEESKHRLGLIFDKIDKDQDGSVTQEELRNWIHYVQMKYVLEDCDRQWEEHEREGDRLVWDKYHQRTYGDIQELEEEEEDTGYSVKTMQQRDKERWGAADKDKDNHLTKEEFCDFLHPEDAEHMKDIVVKETLDDIDRDKDGFISMEEYIGDLWPQRDTENEPEWVKSEREQFSKFRDLNQDGKMDKQEVQEWIMPTDYDHAKAEAAHLLHESDSDQDEKLSRAEVLDKYDLFVGSQATDFGEALTRHDEF